MKPNENSTRLWRSLVANGNISKLDLPTIEGRYDLRGVAIEPPIAARRQDLPFPGVSELEGLTTIRGAYWKGIDFSESRLPSLRVFDSIIEDCRFDGASCRAWRIWNTTLRTTSFRDADLTGSALGATTRKMQRNLYAGVTFERTDLRRTSYTSATMQDCLFKDAKLKTIDFQGTVFVRCIFEGDLEDVLFYRHAFQGEAFAPNEMRDVDLRHARLRFVGFRNLDMDRVKWPVEGDVLVVGDYKNVLDRLIKDLEATGAEASMRVAKFLSLGRRWAGANQKVGIVNVADLRAIGDDVAIARVLRHCRAQ